MGESIQERQRIASRIQFARVQKPQTRITRRDIFRFARPRIEAVGQRDDFLGVVRSANTALVQAGPQPLSAFHGPHPTSAALPQ